MSNDILFRGNTIDIYQEGPELVAITKGNNLEYSRLNVKSKKATHWYAQKICDKILEAFPKKQMSLNICCLGSSMGAIPYELLHTYQKAVITCVDIDKESIFIAKHSILKMFGNRVTYKEMDANEFVKKVPAKTFDIVINDMFFEDKSPQFINTHEFIKAIWNILKPKGYYFANTYTDTLDMTHDTLLKQNGFRVERHARYPTGTSNIVSVARKS